MVQEALQKLQKEIGENPNDGYVSFIGGELIKYIRVNPDKAALFSAEGKTIKGSLGAIEKAAVKVRQGNKAMLTPDQGMAVVMEYYGIELPKAEPEPVAVGFNVDLDELL